MAMFCRLPGPSFGRQFGKNMLRRIGKVWVLDARVLDEIVKADMIANSESDFMRPR